MKTVTVDLGQRRYDIVIGEGSLAFLARALKRLKIGQDAFVITNARIKKLYGSTLNSLLRKGGCSVRYRFIPDSEKAKSVSVCIKVLRELAGYDKKKRIFIIAMGGGVTGDLAGFVASVYRRGIPYIQIPTTLLSQVDSAIGGKVAIDLAVGKNLIGAFYQPRLVLSDITLLKSLPLAQVRNGLSEIVKYGLIKDGALFAYLERNYKKIIGLQKEGLSHVVYRCSKIKADVVRRDERDEKEIRMILNCGHTIAHAVEAACGYERYAHGEAVSIGMIVEALLSRRLGLLSIRAFRRLESLLEEIGLPTRLKGVQIDRVMKAQEHDKKIISGVNRFVLPTKIGAVRICRNIPVPDIKSALKERMQ